MKHIGTCSAHVAVGRMCTQQPCTALRLQIGLVDLLREEYGIKPAGILGHSAGGHPHLLPKYPSNLF